MRSFEPSLTAIPKWLVIAFAAVSLIGFIDAAYLAAKHYLGTPIPCSLLEGCEVVTSSIYATIAGIPIALVGTFYYLTLFIASIAYTDTGRAGIIRMAAYTTIIGFLVSLLLLYLQLFVIKALCMYCLISLGTSTILFLLGVVVIKRGSLAG